MIHMTQVIAVVLFTFFVAGISILAGKKYGIIYPIVIFCCMAVIANILAVKIILIGNWTVPAGTLAFMTTYLITDLLSEIWGESTARKAIWAGFWANIVCALMIAIAVWWTPATFNTELSGEFKNVLGGSWRIFLASILAYLISMNLDVTLFHKLKSATSGKWLWLRNNLATIPSNFIGALVFVIIAFYGVIPNTFLLAINLAVIQSIMVLIDTPIAYLVRYSARHIS